jgi:hypothetical protein
LKIVRQAEIGVNFWNIRGELGQLFERRRRVGPVMRIECLLGLIGEPLNIGSGKRHYTHGNGQKQWLKNWLQKKQRENPRYAHVRVALRIPVADCTLTHTRVLAVTQLFLQPINHFLFVEVKLGMRLPGVHAVAGV